MTFSELLSAIRDPYVYQLVRACRKVSTYAEPAYRMADGALVMDGDPLTPFRADLIAKVDNPNMSSTKVDAEVRQGFDPFTFSIDAMTIQVSPFTWDWVPLRIGGLSRAIAAELLAKWFIAWFDPEDENHNLEDGSLGVVHFMSDLNGTDGDCHLTIDLGSVATEAVNDLLFALSNAKATSVLFG